MEKVLLKKLSPNIMVIKNSTGQQRLYSMELVTKKKYYHPLSILPEIGALLVLC